MHVVVETEIARTKTRLEHPPLLIQNTSHATDREASQDNKGAGEESRA